MSSVLELQAELTKTKTRLDEASSEVQEFLLRIGAPNLLEAETRLQRFASNVTKLQDDNGRLRVANEMMRTTMMRMETVLTQRIEELQELRKGLDLMTAGYEKLKSQRRMVESALKTTLAELMSPKFAAFRQHVASAVSGINSTMRELGFINRENIGVEVSNAQT